MLRDYLGIISLNEDDGNIRTLTKARPIGSIPIFGRYRVIDFMLSNMVNSGITNVIIFTLGSSRSLRDHLGTGKPWDLNRKIDGLYVFSHASEKMTINEINLLKSNQESLLRSRKDKVVIAPSYMLCNMDLDNAGSMHEESGADVTIIYKKINGNQLMFRDCDILNFETSKKRVLSVGKNVGLDEMACVSTEVMIMDKKVLIECIERSLQQGSYTSIKDYVNGTVSQLNVQGFEFEGYLGCINSINSYYKVSMDVLGDGIMSELFMNKARIYTKSNDSPPTKYQKNAEVTNSVIANGCIINGKVKNSILSRGVIVEKGAEVVDSIIFARSVIREDAIIKNAILDKTVYIENGKVLIGDQSNPIVIEKGKRLL